MEPIVLVKIKSLHVRILQETGLNIRFGKSEIPTGPIAASLDDCAEVPANTGMIDLAAGTIRLQWAVIATLSFTADAFASGAIPPKDSAPIRVTLDESGQILDDGSGFSVKGTGQIGPGSVLSAATIPTHQNVALFVRIGSTVNFRIALAAGDPVPFAFVPDSSAVDLKLPKSLGGGTRHVNLVGGFVLAPLMTLDRPDRTKRTRR
jgi:hypothetical protein